LAKANGADFASWSAPVKEPFWAIALIETITKRIVQAKR
jgi:hypothetical protein